MTTDNISSYIKRNTNSMEAGESLRHLNSSSRIRGGRHTEVPGAVVKEVGAGRMRDTIFGAYSFALLKNSVISTKGQA
jgi:hypothetical protein